MPKKKTKKIKQKKVVKKTKKVKSVKKPVIQKKSQKLPGKRIKVKLFKDKPINNVSEQIAISPVVAEDLLPAMVISEQILAEQLSPEILPIVDEVEPEEPMLETEIAPEPEEQDLGTEVDSEPETFTVAEEQLPAAEEEAVNWVSEAVVMPPADFVSRLPEKQKHIFMYIAVTGIMSVVIAFWFVGVKDSLGLINKEAVPGELKNYQAEFRQSINNLQTGISEVGNYLNAPDKQVEELKDQTKG